MSEDESTRSVDRTRPAYKRKLLEEAKDAEEPVTEVERRDRDGAVVVHAIEEVDGSAYLVTIDQRTTDSEPRVKLSQSTWDSDVGVLRDWSEAASGPSAMRGLTRWERFFTVFNVALDVYNRNVREDGDGDE